MASSIEYTIVIIITNEAGDVIKKTCTVSALLRPWSMLKSGEAIALMEHLLHDYRSQQKKNRPGWSTCWD